VVQSLGHLADKQGVTTGRASLLEEKP
jgi:hypothetical protein